MAVRVDRPRGGATKQEHRVSEGSARPAHTGVLAARTLRSCGRELGQRARTLPDFSESEGRSVTSHSLRPRGPYSQSTEFSRSEPRSAQPFPPPGHLLTQEWSRGLLHCRQLSHQGSPRTPECAAFPSSRASSDPGVEPGSPALQVESLPAELSGKRRASLGLRDAPARVAGGAGQGVENTGRGGGEQTSMRAPADPGPRGHPCVEVCAKRGSSCGSRLICKALADPQLLETDGSFVGISHARGRDAEQDRPEGK